MALPVHDLEDVGERISKNASYLQQFLTTSKLPKPSFNIDAPTDFPNPDHERSVEIVRENLIEDTRLLFDLIIGPIDRIKWGLWQVNSQQSFQNCHSKRIKSSVHGHCGSASNL